MFVVLTNSQDTTADYLCDLADKSGKRYLRLDTDILAKVGDVRAGFRDGAAFLNVGGAAVSPDSVTAVWYRRPRTIVTDCSDDGVAAFLSNEWAAALEGWLSSLPRGAWVNHPNADADAMVKLRQLVVARDVGLKVPATLVSQDPVELKSFARQAANGVVGKPLYGGLLDTAAGPKAIYTTVVEQSRLAELDRSRSCPTLLQHRIEKGVDVRLTVMDDAGVGVAIRAGDGHVDVRHGNMAGACYSEIELPGDVMDAVWSLMRRFALRFAAIDFVVSQDGDWYFLEVNPGGQWAWLDLEAKTNIGQMLLRQLTRPQA